MSKKLNFNYNLLNISKNPITPYIIAAFSIVYGVEFNDLIKERINNSLFLHYRNLEGIKYYTNFLRCCKSKELAVEFLRCIGYTVPKKDTLNYADAFEEKLERLINNYLGASEQAFNRKNNASIIPLKLVEINDLNDTDKIKKVKLLNQICGVSDNLISIETLKKLEKTDNYNKIIGLISEFKIVYDKLLEEFKEWEKRLDNYERYILEENKRKKLIFKNYEKRLDNYYFGMLPEALKERINALSVEEREHFLFGKTFSENQSIFEAFSRENMRILYDENSPLYKKYWIIGKQINFFKYIGVDIPNEQILVCSSEEDVKKYRFFLEKEDIKCLLPDPNLCEEIVSFSKMISEEAIKEYYYTSVDFLKLTKYFYNDKKTKYYFYEIIKKRKIFVLAFLKNDFEKNCNHIESFLCYTIGLGNGGCLAYTLIHEFGHVIDYSLNGSGFEDIDDLSEKGKCNIYNKKYRYYERFNEAINDIFTLEAIKILNDKGIYLLEEKSLTSERLENNNTSKIIKDLIRPLIKKYRCYVVDVKITSVKNKLTDYVGEKNFEDLVDAVNKVDYLVSMGLSEMLVAGRDTELVQDYYKELDRVNKIYIEMDEYYNNHINNRNRENTYKRLL